VCPRDAHDVQLARHRPVAGERLGAPKGFWAHHSAAIQLLQSRRPHAEPAHVAERHRLDRLVEAGLVSRSPSLPIARP
jgi:hypothetical protein